MLKPCHLRAGVDILVDIYNFYRNLKALCPPVQSHCETSDESMMMACGFTEKSIAVLVYSQTNCTNQGTRTCIRTTLTKDLDVTVDLIICLVYNKSVNCTGDCSMLEILVYLWRKKNHSLKSDMIIPDVSTDFLISADS